MPTLDSNALRDALAYVDRWIALRRESHDLPGYVVAVRHGGEMLLSKAYGFAQLEPPVPMSTQHLFRIASHSKTFTATAVMQLVERGKLRLDDRASTYIPWLTSDATIRQLLNHVGGIIRDGRDTDFWSVEQPFPDLATLRALVADMTVLPNNTSFKYSNIGYALLGLAIEAASGVAYNEYVKEHIIRPLGLQDTGPEFHAAIADRMVTGYVPSTLGVSRRAAPNVDTHAMSAATGFYSTAEDLSRYAAAHCFGDESLLTDASKREMQHPAWSAEQSEDQYGLGMSVQKIGDRQLVGHGGGFPGQSTRTLIDPVERLVVVVFSNSTGLTGLAAPVASEIVRIIEFSHARLRRDGAASTTDLHKYTGRFASPGGVLDIAAFGSSLVAVSPEADDPVHFVTDLEVLGPDRLRIAKTGGYGSLGETVEYERDAAGRITRVVFAGGSLFPEDVFRERYAEQPRWFTS
jgi:CubicO group peptidase (beta-lactamase class C family)